MIRPAVARPRLFASAVMHLNRLAALLAAGAVLVMMLVGVADILGTRFFNRPIPGTHELTETMMVAAIFLSLAIAQAQGRHVRVEMLVDRLGPRGRAAFGALADVASMLAFALIAWYGWRAGITATAIGEFTSGQIPFPIWPAKLCLAVGASLAVVQCAVDARRHLARLAGRGDEP